MFPSTRRTLIEEARRGEQGGWNALAEMYWQPCYRYVRWRFGVEHEQAQDLVQSFYAGMIAQGILERYDGGRGNFRPYLRACLEQSVRKQLQAAGREKRGGKTAMVALETGMEVASGEENPEERFEREWEREVFAQAIEEMRREHGDSVRFQIFAAYDLAEGERQSYEELARQFGVPVTAVTNHLAWARRELGRRVRGRI